MEKKSNFFVLTILVLSVGLALTTVLSSVPERVDQVAEVAGSYSVTIEPELARVSVGYVNTGSTAEAAQDANANVMNAVKSALEAAGVEDVETVSFSVYPEYDYSGRTRRVTGYTARHILQIETENINEVGNYIDIAVNSGANQINSIEFDVSDGTRKELRSKALSKASEDARDKADAIADGLGMRVMKVVSVTDQSSYVSPYYRGLAVAEAGVMGDTEITPGDLEVSANVRVTFGIA
jgi:uncharacterized protein YggE